jgi:hypothetical protein
MAITEIGESIQIRILYEDGEKLKKLKQSPEEPWYKVINRLLIDYDKLRKQQKGQLHEKDTEKM